MWIILSALTALSQSLQDIFSKKNLLKNIDEYLVSWSLAFFAFLFLIHILIINKIPAIGDNFWWIAIIGGVLNLFAFVLYIKAIKSSDLSITVPMMAFTPIFLLLTSPFMVGEFPNLAGISGVVLIAVGSYVLNIKERKNGFLKPFSSLIKEKGPKLMLGVALIWSITSNIDKIGVQNSSPIFWATTNTALIATFLLPIILMRKNKPLKEIFSNSKSLIPLGIFNALVKFFQMNAVNLAMVSYVISIKRTSILLSVILGVLIFKEKNIKERLIGVIIMFIGVLLITLFG